jgi:hypothetical protein
LNDRSRAWRLDNPVKVSSVSKWLAIEFRERLRETSRVSCAKMEGVRSVSELFCR